jgi:2-amino-4-hydroxy-6-hydroxymethyldihydropteridine diphosphokinase
MEPQIFLLLGTNLGNRPQNLERAIFAIAENIGSIRKMSSVYKTAAWGKTDQAEFYNQVVLITTSLDPLALLAQVVNIEKILGRVRTEKWGPRLIDIDILFYDQLIIENESLTIPHPGIPGRRFTLVPLCEIAPGFIHPQLNKEISVLLDECEDPLAVEPVTRD